jgi:hypothetical protein
MATVATLWAQGRTAIGGFCHGLFLPVVAAPQHDPNLIGIARYLLEHSARGRALLLASAPFRDVNADGNTWVC